MDLKYFLLEGSSNCGKLVLERWGDVELQANLDCLSEDVLLASYYSTYFLISFEDLSHEAILL